MAGFTKIPRFLRLTLLASSVALPVAVSAGAARGQGLFDFLFGGHSGPAYSHRAYAYGPDPDPFFGGYDVAPPRQHRRSRRARPREASTGDGTPADYQTVPPPTKQAPPIAGDGPLGPFANDPTLRAGDIVVTSQGMMVFRGPEDEQHSARDFVSISKARGVAAGRKRILASIEKANRLQPSDVETGHIPAQPVQEARVTVPRTHRRR